MKIGFDIDGVLGDFVRPFLVGTINPYLGRKVTYEEITDFDFSKTGIDKGTLGELVAKAGGEGIYRSLPSLPTVDIARRCQERGDNTYFVTARPDNCTRDTFNWLKGCGLDISDGVFIVREKGVVTSRLSLDVFVEDALHHTHDVAPHVGRVYLLARPWNKDGYQNTPDNVYRVTDEMLSRELKL
jgi:uncharacterized HAD superfamily protein